MLDFITKYRKYLVGVFVVLIVVVVVMRRHSAVPVTTEKPSRRELVVSLDASGEIKAEKESDLVFTSTGTLASLNVSEGTVVQKGQILASLNGVEAFQNLQDALLSREKAIAAADEIRETYGDDVTYGVGYYRLKQANKAIDQTSTDIAIYQQQLSNLVITAPFTGTVLGTNKHPGEMIKATDTQPIAKLADLSELYFEMEIDEEDIGEVNVTDDVLVSLDAYPNKLLKGKVSSLKRYTTLDAAGSKVVEVKVLLNEQPDFQIILGLSGDAEIIKSRRENVLTISSDAIQFIDGDSYVFVVVDGKAKKAPIKLGGENAEFTEVVGGIDESSEIIVKGVDGIEDGDTVSIEQ